MRFLGLAMLICITFSSCEMNTNVAKSKIDSTVTKLDSAAERIGDKAETVWDSTKVKARELNEDLDSTF